MAGFDYLGNLTAVVDVLKDANTITAAVSGADLSADLGDGKRILDENIKMGDPDVEMLRMDRVPAIFVRVDAAQEEFASIGATGPSQHRKFKEVTYSIFAVFGRAGGSERHTSAMTGIAKMVRNIEAVFQHNYQLDNTALWCQPKRTVISNVPLDPQMATWMKVAAVDLEARYFFR